MSVERPADPGSTVPESQSDHPIPKFVRKTLSLDDGSSFTLALKECDVIIFDLMLTDLKKVEYAIKTLTYEDLQKPKILILISSVRIWAKTAAKVKVSSTDMRKGKRMLKMMIRKRKEMKILSQNLNQSPTFLPTLMTMAKRSQNTCLSGRETTF